MKTHRSTLFIALVVAIAATAFSCCPPRSLVAGGGCGFTNFNGEETSSWDTGSRLDLFAGVDFNCENSPVNIATLLSYQKRGADFEDTFTDGSISYTFSEKLRLNYVYLEGEGSADIVPGKLEVTLAPQIGYLVNATSDQESSLGGGTKETVTEFYQDIDFGVRGGLRFNLTEKFALGAHYYQGLSNVQDNFNAKNNGIHVRLEYNLYDFK